MVLLFSEDWREFLSINCLDYPSDLIDVDADYLAQQHLAPNLFRELIETFELRGRKEMFYSHFTMGNSVRFFCVFLFFYYFLICRYDLLKD